jgi:catechol 2,3-dioxygenase-like lactoylglutathione lyase family enzyme
MIQHVTRQIRPSELDRCVEFYGMLGFGSVPVPPGIAGRALWLERHGTQVHLMPVADAGASGHGSRCAGRRPGSGHVGIVVDCYADTLARLQHAGYEVDPRHEHWGSPRCYVHDPGGHLVELMAWAPGSPEDAEPA